MEKVSGKSVLVGLQERMACMKGDAEQTEGLQHRKPIRVLKNPNPQLNSSDAGVRVSGRNDSGYKSTSLGELNANSTMNPSGHNDADYVEPFWSSKADGTSGSEFPTIGEAVGSMNNKGSGNKGNNANATVVYPSKPQQLQFHDSTMDNIIRDQDKANGTTRTKLFGVPLLSKKRTHPEYGNATTIVETHKARLILEKDDLGLKLMPPSTC